MKVKFFENFKHWRWAAGIGVMSAIGLALIPVWIEFQWYDDGKRFLGERAMKAEEIPAIIPARVETEELTVERILEWSRELLKSKTDDLPQNEITKIILGGDVMLGRAVNFNMHRKNNFGYPMEKIAERFKQADLALVNLEAPILTDCLLIGEGMKFCSNYQSLYTLFFAGIDAVQLANNHIWDYGDAGIEETQKWLEFQGIGYVGLGDPLVREVRGIKFGFLGYNQIFPIKEPVSTANERVLKQEIEELQLGVDVVIVGFHWGTEYQGQPSYVQRQLAKAAVEAGADLVWGHHPHVVQGIEVYQGTPIFYSLGNLVFDQMWSKETREGLVLEVYFWNDMLVEAKLLPVFMNDFAQPDWQATGVGSVVLGRVEKYSYGLGEN